MGSAPLDDVNQAQQERLFHIDFKLRFFGAVNRADLVTRFGIKAAAATRDLSLYKELASKNLVYDTKAKTYIQSDFFKPIFDYSQNQALTALCYGLGDDYVGSHQALISAETPTQLNAPQMDILAKVSQSIYQKRALRIRYRSLSSGLSTREIVPFALVDNGLRWHVRAYDRKRERFSDFVISRISKPELCKSYAIAANETKEADIQWNRIVEMHLVPHPRLQYPETIEYEYGMQNGMLKVNIRAAVAGYVLRRWNVDCSENHALKGAEYHLWLKNRQTLYGVENLVLAPGYSEDALDSQKPQGQGED
ncbi:helix-turn-helix transcriptional regulator [Microbulbifer guangxiensis]|uniref:helix-turn-helix transcriptional regulator n=1 Tax=Microbulbifer guangxiensis TaxID=2904249 RepID=UPI001F300FFF|nr:WYL domain-containing protein [Microbulbifer guangxiensis]